MTTRRILLPFLAVPLLLAACAPAERIGRDPSRPAEVLSGGAVLMDDAPERADALIPASPETVWRVLADAYAAVGIEVAHRDEVDRIMGNRQLQIRRTLGDVRASEYFECGHTVSGAAAADSYRIRATVTTQVLAVEGGTRLVTAVGATGRALQGTSSGEVRCGSTGRLEDRIRSMTIVALAGA